VWGGGESGRRACWGAGASILRVRVEQGLPGRGLPWWRSLATGIDGEGPGKGSLAWFAGR
jgi:hypothetical protein